MASNGSFFSKVAPAVPIVGSLLSGIFQGAQNRKNRKFAREMYNTQWANSTAFSREMYGRQKADQIAFWNMVNKYNDPSAEMARLKAAGLNPALMYGSGAQANRAESVGRPSALGASASVPAAAGRAPSFDLGSSILSYNQTRIADKQMQLLDAEKNLKLAQAFSALWGGKTAAFDLGLKRQSRIELLNKIAAESQSAVSDSEIKSLNARVAGMVFDKGYTVKRAIADAVYPVLRNKNINVQRAQLQATIQNLLMDVDLKAMEKDLRSNTGASYSSGGPFNMLLRLILSQLPGGK